jgi:beta-glucosidase
MKKLLFTTILSIFLINCSQNKQLSDNNSPKTTIEVEQQIQKILQQMTLKEKVGQMLNIGLPTILTGGYWDARDSAVFDTEKFKKFIIDYGVGSIHNTPGYPAKPKDWNRIIKTIQDAALSKTRLKIPVLYGIDDIHGANYVNGSVMFPHEIGLAATWNTELAKVCGDITSYESRAASLPWNFNPNIDVAMNPLWGRIGESFGEDPYLISKMATAYIEGSQKNNLSDTLSTAVCLKHFIGYGGGRNGKDRANALIPENSLRQYYLPPFKAAIDAGAMGVMISSNSVNGIPCHINKYYITDILKGELGFKGVVISDFSDVEFLVEAHQSAKNMRDATKMAVNAGLDMIMNPYDAKIVGIIIDLVENKEIPISRINDAVTRILRLKLKLNLFEKPYNNSKFYKKFGSEKHIESNYKIAGESITLLKNSNNLLPLPLTKKVLVTGYAANSINVLNGAWSRSFLGTETKYNDASKYTILTAIQKQLPSNQVEYAKGTDYQKDINTDKVIQKARNSDYIIVCLGEQPATEKPSDINELALPKVQLSLVKKLAKLNKPIILVLVEGRPRIIKEIEPLVDVIVMAYLPGQEGGRAISDVLFGKINPSGKLPYTYPKYTGNILTYYHKKTDIRDVTWGYNGFYPQFEFGFGLSYSNYKYSNFIISKDTLKGVDKMEISVDLQNTGNYDGKEIIELYLKDMVATVAPDSKKLIRFSKILLKKGETKKVLFFINSKDLASVGIHNKWIIEEGDFELQIGGNPQKLIKKKFYYKN